MPTLYGNLYCALSRVGWLEVKTRKEQGMIHLCYTSLVVSPIRDSSLYAASTTLKPLAETIRHTPTSHSTLLIPNLPSLSEPPSSLPQSYSVSHFRIPILLHPSIYLFAASAFTASELRKVAETLRAPAVSKITSPPAMCWKSCLKKSASMCGVVWGDGLLCLCATGTALVPLVSARASRLAPSAAESSVSAAEAPMRSSHLPNGKNSLEMPKSDAKMVSMSCQDWRTGFSRW